MHQNIEQSKLIT